MIHTFSYFHKMYTSQPIAMTSDKQIEKDADHPVSSPAQLHHCTHHSFSAPALHISALTYPSTVYS